MANEQQSVFISYSRTDSAFIDRLDADLRARGYSTWVDRRRLEGGQYWEQEIDAAIVLCDLFLLVLSPSSVNSIYVRHEFEESERLDKRLIPLVWQAQGLVIPAWLY
jgi:hypothetical protein